MENEKNSYLHVRTTKEKSDSAASQKKTFNRLIKKVQDLQIRQENMNRDLDEALQFYYTSIHPDEVIYAEQLAARVHAAYEWFKGAKGFPKKELKLFKSWLTDQVDELCNIYERDAIPAKVKDIFKELHGKTHDEHALEEMTEFKEGFQEKFKMFFGEEVELSDEDLAGSQEDILRKLFMKMGKAAAGAKEKARTERKTKRQLEKEAKKKALEDMQSKSLHTIYKQLARVLHPDLESDPEKRIFKEELMKKLTVAHDKNDLYSLLAIETEWMSHSVDKMQFHNDSEIKIYNAILKDQVKELEIANSMLFGHPRYAAIERFYRGGFFTGIFTLQRAHAELKGLIKSAKDMTAALLDPSRAKATVKEIIQGQSVKNTCTCGSC